MQTAIAYTRVSTASKGAPALALKLSGPRLPLCRGRGL